MVGFRTQAQPLKAAVLVEDVIRHMLLEQGLRGGRLDGEPSAAQGTEQRRRSTTALVRVDFLPEPILTGVKMKTSTVESNHIHRFFLVRHEDVSGSSGIGIVARGVVRSPDGSVVLFFADSIKIFKSVELMMKVHGHEGRTVFHWQDEPS